MSFETNSSATEAKCCVDFCKTTFNVSGQEVVNNYKCNQGLFSVLNLWNIERRKHKTATRTVTSGPLKIN